MILLPMVECLVHHLQAICCIPKLFPHVNSWKRPFNYYVFALLIFYYGDITHIHLKGKQLL